jgi:hypothetical protein
MFTDVFHNSSLFGFFTLGKQFAHSIERACRVNPISEQILAPAVPCPFFGGIRVIYTQWRDSDAAFSRIWRELHAPDIPPGYVRREPSGEQ